MPLLPKYSIRQMLLAMVVIAFFCACISGAAKGNSVAFGLTVAIFGLAIPAIVCAVGYWVLYAFASIASQILSPGKVSAAKSAGDSTDVLLVNNPSASEPAIGEHRI